MKKLFLISGLLVAIVSSACKKNEPEITNYSACMQAKSPNPDELFNFIQGRWKLTEKYCNFCTTPNKNLITDINYTLVFKQDSTVEITSDDIIFPPQKFIIASNFTESPSYFVQIANSPIGTYGMTGILFKCGDKIGFSSAYVDGPTYIYTKQPN